MCQLKVILGFAVLFTSCNTIKHQQANKMHIYTQSAVFEYLKAPNIVFDILTGKGLILLDPRLQQWHNLTTNGKRYFSEPIFSDELKQPTSTQAFRLSIPDSLKQKYGYAPHDPDYEHSYAIIHQFSPLLSTKEPGVYLMEHYLWASTCESGGCVRCLERGYLRFRIDEDKVFFLGGVSLMNTIDFIGFGSFAEKDMLDARPGDKIKAYGH